MFRIVLASLTSFRLTTFIRGARTRYVVKYMMFPELVEGDLLTARFPLTLQAVDRSNEDLELGRMFRKPFNIER